jgi:hypothetical protein
MAENYLFTTDSFVDYFDHLKEDGYLIIVAHGKLEIYKLVVTALAAFGGGGDVKQGLRQLVIASGDHHGSFPVFTMKKHALDQAEVNRMIEKALELNLTLSYYPGANPGLDPILSALAEERIDLIRLIYETSRLGVDLRPPTDDSPFFYKFEAGLPYSLNQVLASFFVTAMIASLLHLGFWNRGHERRVSRKATPQVSRKFSAFMLYYFASLGLGFMLVEVSLIQKFMLFLGPPTLTISVVLLSLFLSVGVGSLFSQRWGERAGPALWASLLTAVSVILYTFALPFIFAASLGLSLNSRVIISFVLLYPLGFLMGVPFPSGMRIVHRHARNNDVAWVWGISSLYSSLGSTLALSLAMLSGFSTSFLLGGLLYLTIFLAGRFSLER